MKSDWKQWCPRLTLLIYIFLFDRLFLFLWYWYYCIFWTRTSPTYVHSCVVLCCPVLSCFVWSCLVLSCLVLHFERYSQKYLFHSAEANLQLIQEAMGALAFKKPSECPVPQYRDLFHEDRWRELADFCLAEILTIYGLSLKSPLITVFQVQSMFKETFVCAIAWCVKSRLRAHLFNNFKAGLSTMKTPMCGTESRRCTACPVCR